MAPVPASPSRWAGIIDAQCRQVDSNPKRDHPSTELGMNSYVTWASHALPANAHQRPSEPNRGNVRDIIEIGHARRELPGRTAHYRELVVVCIGRLNSSAPAENVIVLMLDHSRRISRCRPLVHDRSVPVDEGVSRRRSDPMRWQQSNETHLPQGRRVDSIAPKVDEITAMRACRIAVVKSDGRPIRGADIAAPHPHLSPSHPLVRHRVSEYP